MPLFELVLSFPDRREVRLTDRPVAVGHVLELDHRHWRVAAERPAAGAGVETSYVCEPARFRTENGRARERLDAELAGGERALGENISG